MPDDPDASSASSRHRDDALDEAYHEYLWGEPSPRSFARKAELGRNTRESRYVVQVGETVDVSRSVSR